MSPKLLLKVIFYLPATTVHEYTHWITSLVFGRPESFSLRPKIEGDTVVFGQVTASVRYRIFGSLIGIAPLIWWAALYYLLRYLHVFYIDLQFPRIYFALFFDRFLLSSFSVSSLAHMIFYAWLCIQLLWAGKLSLQDVTTFVVGAFSFSGLVFFSAAAFLYLVASQQ